MSDDLSEQDRKRLNDLAALRDRGVLSEEEFQRARQRLLDGRAAGGSMEALAQPTPRRLFPLWLILTLISLTVLLFVLWFGVVRGGPEPETNTTRVDELVNEAAGPLPGPELCASDALYAQIADAIFDRAVEAYAGEARPLLTLRRAIGVRMQYPVLRDVDPVVERTDCSGRLVIDIPPDARDEFEGAAAIQADVDYSLQPAADGGAALVELDGVEVLVQRLAGAATNLAEGRTRAERDASGLVQIPPLDCGGEPSGADRLICGDEELARRHIALASRLAELGEALGPAGRERLAEVRSRFLERRSACPDAECLTDLYASQIDLLDRLEEERPNQPVAL